MNSNTSLCGGCGTLASSPFFDNQSAPASVGKLSATQEEASNSQCGQIKLVACKNCGLVENPQYDPHLIGFEPGYEVSLLHTPTFQHYIQTLCDRLIEAYQLKGKKILEIGCGSAEFLHLICHQGGNHGVGIDPTLSTETTTSCGAGTIKLIPDYFSEKHEQYIGDFVCCLSVFEDIPAPVQFLKSLRDSIGNRNIPMYFEVFNGFRAIAEEEVWSVHYEQCNYFSPESLRNMFQLAGFEVTQSGTCYKDDQYIYVEVIPTNAPTDFQCELPPAFSAHVQRFSQAFNERREWWVKKLDTCREREQRVVCWGSGGKGVSFLSSLPNNNVIQSVIDINPDRQNHYMPTGSQLIVGPETLTEQKPDVVVITNQLYQQEITQTLADMNLNCELVVA